MHADAYHIDVALVRQLVVSQMPQLSQLPLTVVTSTGTDNVLYRLGSDLVVRLPMRPSAADNMRKEFQYVPLLAPQLPLRINTPIALGEPTDAYPAHWAVYDWLPGETAWDVPVQSMTGAAQTLAQFVRALWQIQVPETAPVATVPYGRGVALHQRIAITEQALQALTGHIDVVAARAVWQQALDVPAWQSAPVWVHGDIQPTNLLVQAGHIHAVIDFGTLAVGDPAVDLLVAWNYLDAESRCVFRQAVAVDDDTWLRGRAWALSVALLQLPYYLHTNPVMVASARRVITTVLADAVEADV